jgi:hypothetical protein
MEQVCALSDLPLPNYSSDLLDRALLELQQNDFHVEVALSNVTRLTKDDFDYLEEWTPQDVAAFEDGIRSFGHELHSVAGKLPERSMAQIVRFFYKWKKTDRYEPVYSEWTKIYKPKYDSLLHRISLCATICLIFISLHLQQKIQETRAVNTRGCFG